jgi:ubiquinone/menaquinone biosynthesis C-methylase UbiE
MKVNYDEIAGTFDARYTVESFEGVFSELCSLARQVGARAILEVGCGSGHWIARMKDAGHDIWGVDLSLGMLQQARAKNGASHLVQGTASMLPLRSQSFDLVFCINAIHHFDRPQDFVREARRLIRPGGALAVTGMNPHAGRDRWYVYDYFPRTVEIDLRRYPSAGTVVDWMDNAGFDHAEWRIPHRIVHKLMGHKIFTDPALQKNGTSQLALLTDEEYSAGIERIKGAIAQAAAKGEPLAFGIDISLAMVIGFVSARSASL